MLEDNVPPQLIENIEMGVLKPWKSNPRAHSKKQITQISRSLTEYGWMLPILIDEADNILAGHGRVAAAKLLGYQSVPAIRAAHLTEAQKQAYVLADNKIAENATWDQEILKDALQILTDFDASFDLTITGFDTPEIDLVFGDFGASGAEPDEIDALPEMAADAPAITQAGDLWYLGKHRLLCGDATDGAAFAGLMGDGTAQMVFTDPPYNVPIGGHVCGRGAIQHREFAMASGEMSDTEFEAFLSTFLGNLATYSTDGSLHFVCMDWRHIGSLLTTALPHYTLQNLCVWNKTNGGLGSLYRSKHELIPVFKRGSAAHINNIELGKHGRYRTNVWDYAGVNTFREGRLDELAAHPTVKPVAMVADAIRDCSHRNGLVLDCFAGSGTTLLAAQTTGRRAYTMELDPIYVDVAIRRWQHFTGDTAVLAATGQSFAGMAAERGVEGSDG